LLVLLAVMSVVNACGGGAKTKATSPASSATSPSPSRSSSCQFQRDFVTPTLAPLIQVQPPGAVSPTAITQRGHLPCSTVLRVAQLGAADSAFGNTALCQLTQDAPDAGKIARLTTRDPINALFRLGEGRIRCTMTASGIRVELCDLGTLLITGMVTQGRAICDQEPVFGIAAFSGSLQVTDPEGGEFEVPPGQQLTFDFETRRSTMGPAEFTTEDIQVFAAQAAAMHARVEPAVSVPMSQTPPTVTRASGGQVSATNGEWTGTPPITFAYQWQGGCDFDGNGCTDIAGATQSTYQPTNADCDFVRVVVTATNAVGSASSISDPFDIQCIG
jgi:hypothetical protein